MSSHKTFSDNTHALANGIIEIPEVGVRVAVGVEGVTLHLYVGLNNYAQMQGNGCTRYIPINF